ncbi:MAG: glycoside hydrolase family 65 protein [Candidatus Omnitrophica bacterium]|nr:glycoside hydrolase family 65 protein [Candidatus Omnitrophota bacterium]MCB9747126.1 glycoside hydrolase family 65 protein [Candidatus Omnitrophota bacterium]
MKKWKLTYNKFIPEEESLRESLCTLGNGYFGTRGAIPESSANKVHYPGTYIAGVYNTLTTEIANRLIANEDFVNCPNWLMLTYRIDNGPWINRQKVKILSWKVELNMRKGILSRRIRWQDDKGRRTLVESHCLVSMAHPHCGGLRITITPENYSGTITVRSGIDGLIINAGVDRYKQLRSKHLEPYLLGAFGEQGIFLQMQTNQSNIQITEALRNLFYLNNEAIHPELKIISHGKQRIMHETQVNVKKGEKFSIEKLVSLYTSRDHGVADNCAIAQDTVNKIENFEILFKAHQARWKALWKRYDVEVEGDSFVQLALRLHIFHLLQSASTYNDDIDAGMPVRGLHGEAYRGHIFWDELYVFPFYNLHSPEITRALLMYRYRRLGAAKENAKQQGFKGAMYPWQTASTGEEVTQIIHLNPLSGVWGPDYSSLQRHVSIAIAYNVWNYHYTTGDRDFLDRCGAEMILEIAHFWSSSATFNKKSGKFEIEGVMGPDEFHEKYPGANKGGLKNNAYTNIMVVWILEKALYIIDKILTEEERNALLLKVEVSQEEVARWREMILKMAIPMDKQGLIHQFEGYMDLEELDWEEYRNKYDNIHRIDRILKAEGLSPDSYKVSKQADVLMLFYVLNIHELKDIFKRLGYPFSKEIMRKNFRYYFDRTSHGSTLSMVVHAYVADLLDIKENSYEYFIESLKSDIYDSQGGTTQEGIHAGVMGGTIDLFLRNYGGLNILEDRICLDPKLPKHWKKIKFSVRYKNIWFYVVVFKDAVTITAEPLKEISLLPTTKIPIEVRKETYQLLPGKPHTISTRDLFQK